MPEFGQSIPGRRAVAVAQANALVGDVRRRFITDIPGQEMTYQAKETEARAYVAEAVPPETLAAYPMLASEIGITAPTPYEVAQVWLNLAALWRQVSAVLEPMRLVAVAQIEAATTRAAIDAALDTLREQLGAF